MSLTGFTLQHLPAFKNNWKRFLFLGIVLFALGIFAIYASTFTTLVSVIFLGFVLFVGGVLIAFDTFSFWWKKWNGFFVHLIVAILYLAVGICLIKDPVQSLITLTLLLGIFYIAAGVLRIAFSAALQSPQWGWSWLNGLITLLLGILIIVSWPGSSLFIIGLFVGIDLLFAGWSYIMAALAGRRLNK